ncbi:DUF1836 domain-containing protein [Lactiplantibacillus sp. WILCCON 0030]|uniref:DUF1836 domain-containing protein n=1 Tax=Lactiplantibacillus brownii TaxID=3069269 RepID=A0ABU1AEC5_9LACO|nr:DUF1836 domain-containing protein [Lactiplantibacillus brownii]MDQ7938570.1 DUF1836 domain-containing protein [Lactiplantibacillus brownii]
MATTALATFKMTPWDQLPAMPIYMDQLLQLVNQALAPLALPAVTKTMVNSYVKQHFFSRPVGRQYQRNHVVAVMVVTILKQDFSLATISQAINGIRESRLVEKRYEAFAMAFEQTLHGQTVSVKPTDRTTQAVQLAAQTVAYHLLTQQTLA